MALPAQARYYSSDAFPTTLTSALGSTGNPQVASIQGLPTSYPFTVLIDWGLPAQEAISVTSAPTGTGPYTLPCTRGIDNSTGGTGGTAHLSGAVVVHGVTAQDFTQPSQYLAGISGFPWQFNVAAYGAKGDGQIITDATMTNGTAVLTSATGAFTAADAGKYIMVNQGGTNSATAPLLTTILSYQSATQVTLAANCTSAVTNAPAAWGTDDTAAINAAVTAATAYATSSTNQGPFTAQILFGPQIYVLGTGPTQSTSPFHQNAQIPLPVPDVTGAGRKLILEFTGAAEASAPQYWEDAIPNLQGTVLLSMQVGAPSGTFGNQSVIGGPSTNTSLTGGFANIKPVINRITIAVPWNAQSRGMDFQFCAAASVPNASYQAFAPVNLPGSSIGGPYLSHKPTNTNGVALYMPQDGNNADCFVGSFTAECAPYGVGFGEHFNAQQLCLVYMGQSAILIQIGGAHYHGGTILQCAGEACTNVLTITGSSGGQYPLFIGLLNVETLITADIVDSNNCLYGTIYWESGDFSRTTPTVTGAANLQLVNTNMGPGVWTGAPAAPASTVSQQNTAWRDATIYLSATTGITVVSVDGTTTGLTGGNNVTVPVRVPGGQSYTVTYGGTLTTTWILD